MSIGITGLLLMLLLGLIFLGGLAAVVFGIVILLTRQKKAPHTHQEKTEWE